ncbi:MAG: hypothetical protein N2B57_08465 [Planctomycetales bacterium]
MGTIYRNTITTVREKCSEYRRNAISLDDLKKAVWEAAQHIKSADEYDLRKSLQSIEGRLDMVQFTTDSAKIFEATLPIVQELDDLTKQVM